MLFLIIFAYYKNFRHILNNFHKKEGKILKKYKILYV